MSRNSEHGVINAEFFSGLNEVEKAIFLAHREAVIATIGEIKINDEILTFCEISSEKFVTLLPDSIRNIEERFVEMEQKLLSAISEVAQASQAAQNSGIENNGNG
jgi:hypothetical protein